MPPMSNIEKERLAANEGALIQSRPDLGVLIVTGRDQKSWLNGLITCDLAPRRPGDGAYGLAVTKTGKIMSELWLVFSNEHIALAVPKDRLELIRAHLDGHLIMEDAEILDADARSWIFVHGAFSSELLSLARERGADAAQINFTGRPGIAILAPEGQAEALTQALLERAADRGALATEEGWEQIRIEWGLPRFGRDFDDQSLPQEPALERLAVSFTKGCYLGQETVFMLEKRGHVKKRLMRMAIEGEELPAEGAEITLEDGTVIGNLTSRAKHPHGGAIALGYVKYKYAQADQAVIVAGRPARLVGPAAEPSA